MKDLATWIQALIVDYVNQSTENSLGGQFSEKAWGSPLVGFSRGDDPLYLKYKEAIGAFFWTPEEIFLRTFSEAQIPASELTVISWILPQTERTKQDMRREQLYPAKRATFSRTNGEKFNQMVAQYVISQLTQKDYKAVAPTQSELWENHVSKNYGFASSWSERHAAFISGLGTFSLSDTLITEVGTAVRIGSVVANVDVEATPRKYKSFNEYCLYYRDGSCKKCVKRCPAKAISENGHDKKKCREYQREASQDFIRKNYGVDTRYCGLCQFDIPCESCTP